MKTTRDCTKGHQLALGDHACLLYSNIEEYRDIATKYIVEGIYNFQKVICVIHEYEKRLLVKDLLALGIKVDDLINAGQLIITNTRNVYDINRRFDPKASISFWWEQTKQLENQKFKGLRVMAEMIFALDGEQETLDRLMDYELLSNLGQDKNNKQVSLCVYNTNKFPLLVLEDIVKKHTVVISGGKTIKHNPYYMDYVKQLEEKEKRDSLRSFFGLPRVKEYDKEIEDVNNNINDMDILKYVLKVTGDGVWEWNALSKELYVTDAFIELTGISRKESNKFKNIIELIHSDDINDFYNKIIQCINNEIDYFKHEIRVRKKDGIWVWILVVGLPIEKDGNGQVLKLVGILNNIEENKRVKIELEEKICFERLRTDFFANLSHELRTPLNVLLASLQLQELYLNEDKTCRNYNKYSKITLRMKRNCYRLLRLINNLIDITKIDAGFYNVNFINYDVVRLVKSIVLSVEDYVKKQKLKIQFSFSINKIIMACDPEKIERILLNLLSNAIKFTEPGGVIKIKVDRQNDMLIISVKDTGIGIPKVKLPHIFDRFVQADKSLARNKEGSGIGLSLVKALVEMHQGEVFVESKMNEGTEFIIKIPIIESFDGIKHQEEIEMDCKTNIERIHIEFSDIHT